jgi:hypothetical protein
MKIITIAATISNMFTIANHKEIVTRVGFDAITIYRMFRETCATFQNIII